MFFLFKSIFESLFVIYFCLRLTIPTNIVLFASTKVAASRAIHDEELETVAAIAARFLMRSRKANRRLLLQSQSKRSDRSGCGGDENGGAKTDAGGKWVRQRIDVKTDEWHRVRALPMYCSSGRATPVGWGDTSRGREVLPEKNIPHAAGVLLFL